VAIGLVGATLFRIGRYEEAVERLTKSLDVEKGHFNRLGTQAYGYLFLAMAHHRLEHFDESKDWLSRAVELIDARQGVIGYFPGSMFADRLRQETEALLGVEREETSPQADETSDEQIEPPQPSTEPSALGNPQPAPND
jgi:hypothetical protein